MGTPVFAAEILQELIIKGYNISLVVTQPDRKVGRKQIVTATPSKVVALENKIEVFQPEKIKVDYQKVIDIKPDLIITAAYGQIIPDELLKAPTIDAINIHGSLLPKYRGGAPIHYSVLNGDKKTGVTIMKMVSKMDAGDIIFQEDFPIDINDTTEVVHNKMVEVAKRLIIAKLDDILNKNYTYTKQEESKVSYSPNITKEDEKIMWNKSCFEVHNQIRGLSSWPGAYSVLDNERMKVYLSEMTEFKSTGKPGSIAGVYDEIIHVNTQDYQIRILELQMAGKKKMKVKAYLAGVSSEELNGKTFEY